MTYSGGQWQLNYAGGASLTVQLVQGNAAGLGLSGPSGSVAGSSFSVTVTAPRSGYTGTVHFTSSDPQAVLPADYTFTSADAGQHTFAVTLKTAGSQTVTVADTSGGAVSGQATVAVSPASASVLAVSGFPSAVAAGTSGLVTVTLKDAYGNVATGYRGTVHFSSSDSQAGLPADYTFATADAGVHPFSVTLNTAGTQSITATDTVTPSLTGAQTGITVSPPSASAATLVLTGLPSVVTAGTAGSETVTVEDASGNVVTGYRGTVHFTSSDAQASLPADYTFTAADAGSHTFTLTLKTAGTQSLTAADTASGTVSGTQAGITVNPGAATVLMISGLPSSVQAGVAATVTVTALDAFDNTATGYTGTVDFTSSDPQASLPADYTFTAADGGVHTFSVTLMTPGSQTVTVTDTANGSLTDTATSQVGTTFTPVVVDNGGSGYQETGPGWRTTSSGYNGSSRVHAASSTAATASWAVTNLPAGTYNVQVTWVRGSLRSPDAPYYIYDGTTLVATVYVNQQNAPVGTTLGRRPFQSLGSFQINSGTLTVVLGDTPDGSVSADAIYVTT
jgi:hypothetical protein